MTLSDQVKFLQDYARMAGGNDSHLVNLYLECADTVVKAVLQTELTQALANAVKAADAAAT